MNEEKKRVVEEILNSYLDKKIKEFSQNQILNILSLLNNELLLNLTEKKTKDLSGSTLQEFVEVNLENSWNGKNILDVYEVIKKIAEDELHSSINFHWYSKWKEFTNTGNYLTRPDSLDFVELLLRIEEEFDILIKDENATDLVYTSDTIRYIWKKLQT